jgi:MFS family permease
LIFKRLASYSNEEKLAVITFFQNFYLYNHVGALYLQTRGLSLLEINSIWSIIVGTVFLAEVPTGILADKIGRKKSILIALFLQFLGEFFYMWARNYLAFVLIAILAGIGYAFLSGANEALVYDSLPEGDKDTHMKKAMGLIGGAYQLAFFMSPLVGGLVISTLTLNKFILGIGLTAASVLIAFLLGLTLTEPAKAYHHEAESPFSFLKDGLRLLLTNRRIQWITAVAVFTSAFSNSLVTFYQPYFVHFGVDSSLVIGIALSFGGLAAFFIQKNVYTIENKLGRYGLWAISILPGILYLLFANATKIYSLMAIFIFTYAFTDAKNPLISSYQNQLIESKNRATTISLINMFVQSYVAIMGIVFGKIADYSLPATFMTIGVIIILATLLLRVDKITVQEITAVKPVQ